MLVVYSGVDNQLNNNVILFSEKERLQFLGLTYDLKKIGQALSVAFNNYDVNQSSNETTPLVSDNQDKFKKAVDALKKVKVDTDTFEFGEGNKEVVIEELKKYLENNRLDRVCLGLIQILSCEAEEKIGTSYQTQVYQTRVSGGTEKIDFLTAAKDFLKLRHLEAGLNTFSDSMRGLSWGARKFGAGLSDSQQSICSKVQSMQKILKKLPKGRVYNHKLPTFKKIKEEILLFLATYDNNDVMAQQVKALLDDDDLKNWNSNKLDELCRRLVKLIETWMRASKKEVRGSDRARLLRSMRSIYDEKYLTPKEDPLFIFVVKILEQARCLFAMRADTADSTRDKFAGFSCLFSSASEPARYSADFTPKKPKKIQVLEISQARQLIAMSRAAESKATSKPELEPAPTRKAIAENAAPAGLGVIVEEPEELELVDDGYIDVNPDPNNPDILAATPASTEYLMVHASQTEEEQFDPDECQWSARVLTQEGQAKVTALNSGLGGVLKTLKEKLASYALIGAGNRSVAQAVLFKLTEIEEKVKESINHREVVKVELGFDHELTVGLVGKKERVDEIFKPTADYTAPFFNAKETAKKLYQLQKTIEVLNEHRDSMSGKLGWSQCGDIMDATLEKLHPLVLNKNDFLEVEVITVTKALEILVVNTQEEQTTGQENSAEEAQKKQASNYFRIQLLRLKDEVERQKKVNKRKYFSKELNYLLKNLDRSSSSHFDQDEKVKNLRQLSKNLAKTVDNEDVLGLTGTFLDDDFLPNSTADAFDRSESLTQLNKAIDDYDKRDIDRSSDFYQERQLRTPEIEQLKKLVGTQEVDVEESEVYFLYRGTSYLNRVKSVLMDYCQQAAFCGNKSAAETHAWLINLFDDRNVPSFDNQLRFIKANERFKHIDLRNLCHLFVDDNAQEIVDTSVTVVPAVSTRLDSNEGISLIGLYRLVRIEAFFKTLSDNKDRTTGYFTFSSAVDNSIEDDLSAENITFSSPLNSFSQTLLGTHEKNIQPTLLLIKKPSTVLTYKGLVEELLKAFGKFNVDQGQLPIFGKEYPQLRHQVLTYIWKVENSAEYPSRAEKARVLCNMLIYFLLPYLDQVKTPNSAVIKILELIEQTDRSFSRSSGIMEGGVEKYESIVHGRLATYRAHGKPLTKLSRFFSGVALMDAEEAKRLVRDVRAKEKEIREPLDILKEQASPTYDFVNGLSLYDDVPPLVSLITTAEANRDQLSFSCQVIDAKGQQCLKDLHKKAAQWQSRVVRTCRAYYIDLLGYWADHALLLEIKLGEELDRIKNEGGYAAQIIGAHFSLSGFDQKDLTDEKKQDLAEVVLLQKYIDKIINLVKENARTSLTSRFLKALRPLQSDIKGYLSQLSQHYCQISSPTWLGAVDEMKNILEKIEAYFSTEVSTGKNALKRVRFDEVSMLYWQVVNTLNDIQKDQNLNSDHQRLEKLSILLKITIEEAGQSIMSNINRSILQDLIDLNEKIARPLSLGNNPYALKTRPHCTNRVPELDQEEAAMLFEKRQIKMEAENNEDALAEILNQQVDNPDRVLPNEKITHVVVTKEKRSEWLSKRAGELPGRIKISYDYGQVKSRNYAANANNLSEYLSSNAIDNLLAELIAKCRAYARTEKGIVYKRIRKWRFLATEFSGKLILLKSANAVPADYFDLVHHNLVNKIVSDNKQLNLYKLLEGTRLINDALEVMRQAPASASFNSDFKGILQSGLKAMKAHSPRVRELSLDYNNVAAVREAMLEFLSENEGSTLIQAQGWSDLVTFLRNDSSNITNASDLCKQVAKKLVALINGCYRPSIFASRNNIWLNDPRVLGLFKIIEGIDRPVARANPLVDRRDAESIPYYDFNLGADGKTNYLFMRLKSQLGRAVVKDPDEASEMARVANLVLS